MRLPALLPAFTLCLLGCSKDEPSNAAPPPAASTNARGHVLGGSAHALPAPTAPAHPAAEIKWTVPPTWKATATKTRMRHSEYKVPAAGADNPEDSECFVITFPSGQGGSIEQNVGRWTRQFEDAHVADKSQRTVNGMQVTVLDVSGTYHPMAMPNEPVTPPRQGFRMLGAIIDTGDGLWFFKLTGPEATVASAKDAFVSWVDSVKKS